MPNPHGMQIGNWVLLAVFEDENFRGKGDYAMVAVSLGRRLRRAELEALAAEHWQQRDEHWVIACVMKLEENLSRSISYSVMSVDQAIAQFRRG